MSQRTSEQFTVMPKPWIVDSTRPNEGEIGDRTGKTELINIHEKSTGSTLSEREIQHWVNNKSWRRNIIVFPFPERKHNYPAMHRRVCLWIVIATGLVIVILDISLSSQQRMARIFCCTDKQWIVLRSVHFRFKCTQFENWLNHGKDTGYWWKLCPKWSRSQALDRQQ